MNSKPIAVTAVTILPSGFQIPIILQLNDDLSLYILAKR